LQGDQDKLERVQEKAVKMVSAEAFGKRTVIH
jgi:hypothetical protein